jgi:NAD+ kinase
MIRAAGIVGKPIKDMIASVVPPLIAWLRDRNIEVFVDRETQACVDPSGPCLTREELAGKVDLLIVLGGDGTLLSAARALGGHKIPVLPVNLGGLGFLTAITLDRIYDELERALLGEQRVVPRRMLHGDLVRDGQIIQSYEALNDLVINKTQIARMIDLETLVDSQYVSTFKADGLIIATPTGSTAYSLSAGGPILFPAVEALCITPVCPHMLTNRPVVVPATSVIEIICRTSDNEAFLTADGQVGEPLRHEDRIVCRSSAHSIHLVRPPKMFFFDVLRQKLKWGER